MTVKELISILNGIEDKNGEIYVETLDDYGRLVFNIIKDIHADSDNDLIIELL